MATVATTAAARIANLQPLLQRSAAGWSGGISGFDPLITKGQKMNVKSSLKGTFGANVVAPSSSIIEVEIETEPNPAEEVSPDVRASVLACPICYEGLVWSRESALSIESARGATLQCNVCKKE